MTRKTLGITGLWALASVLAACGSSSKAPGIQLAPSSGQTQAVVTTSTTATTPAALASKPVVQVPSGAPPKRLVTKDLVVGTGPTAQSGQTVTVNYVGVLYKGGKEFDSSWKRNTPFSTALSTGSVIPGWVQGIAGMKVGGRRELIIPPSLAYKNASQPGIPPNSTLVFVVDLLSVA
jgi:FKBP-type peptidyl-prolyl cis-trans isomerase